VAARLHAYTTGVLETLTICVRSGFKVLACSMLSYTAQQQVWYSSALAINVTGYSRFQRVDVPLR
jgi:hypothetical protein